MLIIIIVIIITKYLLFKKNGHWKVNLAGRMLILFQKIFQYFLSFVWIKWPKKNSKSHKKKLGNFKYGSWVFVRFSIFHMNHHSIHTLFFCINWIWDFPLFILNESLTHECIFYTPEMWHKNSMEITWEKGGSNIVFA